MQKKGFNLIGIGLILYCINVSLPFFGISSTGLSITFLPASAIASYVLIGLGIRNINPFRNKYKTASVLFIEAACLIGLASLLLPLFTKDGLTKLFDVYSHMINYPSYDISDTYMVNLMVDLFKGVNSYLILILMIEVLAVVGIFIFLSGIKYEKINYEHMKRLNKYGKCSSIFNVVTVVTCIFLIHFYAQMFSTVLNDPVNDVKIILNFFGLMAALPVTIVFSILTLVNKIKFIINIFKTYSNRIVEPEKTSTVIEELI